MRLSVVSSLAIAAALACVAPGAFAQSGGASSVAGTSAEAEPSPYALAIADAKRSMMANPSGALEFATQAEREAGDEVGVATAKWLQGEALNRLNRPVDAAPILEEALAAASRAAKGSKLEGDLFVARAGAARAQGDYTTALSNFQSAHDVFAALGEARSQSIALGHIGSIYTDAGDYTRALDYYRKAGEIFEGDPAVDLSRFNNMANAHKELGQLAEAEEGFRSALKIAEQLDSPLLRMRILTNIASVQLQQGRPAQADLTALSALDLAAGGPPIGWEPFLWGIRAEVALSRGDVRRSADLINRTFDGQSLERTTMPFREFHKAAHDIYSRLGEVRPALAHLEAFKRLDDEARDVAASANLALMGAQFDFATQELQIANLRSETLEREVALQRAQARQRTMVFSGLGVMGLLALIGGGVYFRQVVRSRNEIRAANAQLSDSNTRLAKALKAKSEFLATTSHEIRTPLNGILGMTQLMMQQSGLAPEMRERVQLVHGAGETMRAIVDDILDVSKMETGAIRIMVEDFDLHRVMTDVAHLWRDSASAKAITLDADLDTCPVRMPGDEQRIRQIVFNLLSNAVKFTDAGSVHLGVRCVGTGDEQRLEIEVTDSGVGIPADQIEAIFQPFHQVDGGKTRKFGGTGLGLAICRNLATAMGGEITARSVVGEGSTFLVSLPLPATYAPAFKQGSAAQRGPGADVLFVDPNPLNPFILQPLLAESGLTMETAETLAEAEAALAGRSFSCIAIAPQAIGDDPGEVLPAMMSLREAAGAARLLACIEPDGLVGAPMLRLCGVDDVLEGQFAPATLADRITTPEAQEIAGFDAAETTS
ncbi:tetratricopeptide repeat protein [bacterium]|nr:tetratricopeptide repeat protein [bacterium]